MAMLRLSLRSGVPLLALLLWHFTLVGEEREVLQDPRPSLLTTSAQERLRGQRQVTNSRTQTEGEDLLRLRQTPPADAQSGVARGEDEEEERRQTNPGLSLHLPWKSSEGEPDDHKIIVKSKHNGGSPLNIAQDFTTRKTRTKSNIHKEKSIQEELPSARLGPESRPSPSSILSPLMAEVTSRWGDVVDHHYRQRREDKELVPGLSKIPKENVLFLCDHPPRKFSPSFMGQSNKCVGGQSVNVLPFINTHDFCISIYYKIWNKKVAYYSFNFSEYNQYEVYTDNNYISICLPLHLTFNDCQVHKFFTICHETKTIFVDTNTCPLRDNWDTYFIPLLLWNLYYDDMHCLEKICDGTYEVIKREVNGIQVQLQNTHIHHEGEACRHALDPLELFSSDGILFVSSNIHWPSCYSLYTVAWMGDPGKHGNWSYLPTSCLVGEVVMVVMVACVAISGVVGNTVVVVVMVSGAHRVHQSSMFRTSLAFADLLIGLFVVVPSLYYHLEPFFTPPDIIIWESGYLRLNITEFTVIDEGFPLFQAMLFSVCSFVSIMTVFILSVERFILTWRGLKYGQYFTVPTVKVIIAITWITATLNTLYSTVDEDGSFSAFWDNIYKLPVGTSTFGINIWAYMIFRLTLVVLSVMCISAGIFSVLAIINFVREQARVKAEWRALKMRVLGPIRQENIYIVTSQLLITSFFFLSVIPKGILAVLNNVSSSHFVLFAYIAHWIFLASTAWNPWIYNMRCRQFREDVASAFKVLRARLTKLLCCVSYQR